MNTWAEVEEAVADALWEAGVRGTSLNWTDCQVLARAAIRKIQELRLTAVAGAFGPNEGDNLAINEATDA